MLNQESLFNEKENHIVYVDGNYTVYKSLEPKYLIVKYQPNVNRLGDLIGGGIKELSKAKIMITKHKEESIMK